MEAHTKIAEADLTEFQLHLSLRSANARRRRCLLAFLPPLIGMALFSGALVLWIGPAGWFPRVLWPSTPVLPLYLWLFYRLERRRVASQVNRLLNDPQNRAALGEHVVTISPEGVTDVAASIKTEKSWDQIPQVLADPEYAYIYTSPARAIIVPRRSFPDEPSFQLFARTAIIYHWNNESASGAQSEDEKSLDQIPARQISMPPFKPVPALEHPGPVTG